jgi:hypothetical protein
MQTVERPHGYPEKARSGTAIYEIARREIF